VVYIGTDALVNFVLAGCLGTYYNDENLGYGLDQGEMWRHAVGVAICSEKIAEKVDPAMANQAFTCGLLHDIGKIILNTFVAEEFGSLNDIVECDGLSFIEAEKKVLGFTHAQVGAEIANLWNLPKEIVESIRYHHDPASAKEHPKLVAIVHVGNILCISFGIGIGADGLAYTFHPSSLELLKLQVNDLFNLSIEFHDALKKATDFLTLN